MRPAQPQQVVADGFGQEPLLPEFQDRNGAVALGQFRAVRAVDQRDMREPRLIPAHGLENLHLAERVGQMVVTADDMGDPHVVVIDHHRVQIGRRAIAAQDDHVVHLGIGDADGALHHVLDHRFALLRGFQADRRLHACRGLGRVAIAPAPVIARGAAFRDGLLSHLAEFFGRTPAAIGLAGFEELISDLRMASGAR